jgi:hypothetical protein
MVTISGYGRGQCQEIKIVLPGYPTYIDLPQARHVRMVADYQVKGKF